MLLSCHEYQLGLFHVRLNISISRDVLIGQPRRFNAVNTILYDIDYLPNYYSPPSNRFISYPFGANTLLPRNLHFLAAIKKMYGSSDLKVIHSHFPVVASFIELKEIRQEKDKETCTAMREYYSEVRYCGVKTGYTRIPTCNFQQQDCVPEFK